MDPYEATKIVFSRIQNLDPENASKIMGLLLIQDHGEKEMIRLAFGPENSLQSLVVKARQELGVSSLLSPTNTQPPSPFLSNNTNSADTTCTTPAITMSATTAINSSNNGNNPFSVSRKNSTSTTNATRFLPNGVKIPPTLTIPSLNSPNHLVSSPSWAASVFSNFRIPDDQLLFSPNDSSPAFLSAAAAAFYKGISSSHLGLNSNSATTNNNNNTNTVASTAASSSMNSSTPPFYPSGRTAPAPDLIDEIKLQGQLSFLNNSNSAHASLGPRNHPDLYYPQPDLSSGPGDNSDPLVFSYNGGVEDSWGGVGSVDGLSHRRSCSVNDINFGSEGSGLDDLTCGFGWKPCLYYARGYCKNGSSCRFVHVGLGEADSAAAAPSFVGSPTKFEMMEQCHEILRSKSMQQQKLMAAMASGKPKFPYSPGNKCLNFLLQQQPTESQRVAAAAALMMGEDMHKFGRSRLDTSEFMMNGRPDSNPSSRQIYLTFPADSTFREEDVSNYFSIYGPVQDVRIPYQQKRMFGFVTFVCPETVKMILAKGNPHFVCDARVLVKPYKEKGKVPEKYRKQHQQQVIDRGEFSACNSPIAPDFRDPLDVQNLGARMMYNNTQEMLWRKMEEQADLQQALDLQNRRLMGLHLLDVKSNHHHRTLSTGGGAIPSPTQSPNSFFHHSLLRSDRSSPEAPEENDSNNEVTAAGGAVNDKKLHRQSVDNETEKDQKQGSITVRKEDDNGNGSGEEDSSREYSCLPESLEHNLPDSPFASPSKGAGACMPAFLCSNVAGEPEDAAAKGNLIALSSLPAASAVDMASFKSCYVQMPRFSPGHGAIGM